MNTDEEGVASGQYSPFAVQVASTSYCIPLRELLLFTEDLPLQLLLLCTDLSNGYCSLLGITNRIALLELQPLVSID